MRTALILLHKYTGLLLGLLLSLTGLTGSLLVFDHALDEVFAPETVRFETSDKQASLQNVLNAARAAVSNGTEPTRLYLARQPGSPHVVRFPPLPEAQGSLEVSVAPSNARVLAVRTWGQYPMSWIYRLHYQLLAGSTGKYIVGVGGISLLFFCISGLVLWWPRRGRWRRALTIKRNSGPFRFNYDLHKTVGIYLLPMLLVIAFSGVTLVFHTATEKLVGAILLLEKHTVPPSSPGNQALSVDQIVAIGQRIFPEAELKRVYLPQRPTDSYRLAFNQLGEPWSNHAASALWVDPYNGAVLAVRDSQTLAAGSKFLAWQFPLHNGDALGLPGRWLVFICGCAPGLLFSTGFYMWWRKRRPVRRVSANDIPASLSRAES